MESKQISKYYLYANKTLVLICNVDATFDRPLNSYSNLFESIGFEVIVIRSDDRKTLSRTVSTTIDGLAPPGLCRRDLVGFLFVGHFIDRLGNQVYRLSDVDDCDAHWFVQIMKSVICQFSNRDSFVVLDGCNTAPILEHIELSLGLLMLPPQITFSGERTATCAPFLTTKSGWATQKSVGFTSSAVGLNSFTTSESTFFVHGTIACVRSID